jgi:hypothetical protein
MEMKTKETLDLQQSKGRIISTIFIPLQEVVWDNYQSWGKKRRRVGNW